MKNDDFISFFAISPFKNAREIQKRTKTPWGNPKRHRNSVKNLSEIDIGISQPKTGGEPSFEEKVNFWTTL